MGGAAARPEPWEPSGGTLRATLRGGDPNTESGITRLFCQGPALHPGRQSARQQSHSLAEEGAQVRPGGSQRAVLKVDS